jgi:hypothetical protein
LVLSYLEELPFLKKERKKEGGDLLSHLKGSTIGAEGLYFFVRNGERCLPLAIAAYYSLSPVSTGLTFLLFLLEPSFLFINIF